MPARGGFQLTEDDIQMLKLVHDYRLAHVHHLAALIGRSPKKVHGRLFKLVERHYLSRLTLPQQKHIYTLGRGAVPVLVEQGLAPRELIEWRIRSHELKEIFLKHELMIVDLHATLAVASTSNPVKLVAWKEGQELRDSVTFDEDGERRTLPVRPDAFFALEDTGRPASQNRARFFLEADRSTTSHQRFQSKLTAYWHYLQQGRHTAKYGFKMFRVVTVTLTPERARNLCQTAAATLPPPARKFYLFAALAGVTLQNPAPILGEMFMCPRDYHERRLHPLVPHAAAPFTEPAAAN